MTRAMPLAAVTIKAELADWVVHEDLALSLTDSGEHAYFHVEKRGINTLDVAHRLADALGVRWHEVGFAGRKDKYGVTRQWFSAPTKEAGWPLSEEGITCLEVRRHVKKLRPGEHRGNCFSIRLRTSAGAPIPDIVHTAESMREGFANLFGPQRVSASNVQQARAWLESAHGRNSSGGRGRRAGKRTRGQNKMGSGKRGWYLSVLRSFVFNTIARHRHSELAPGRCVEGDVLLDGFPTAPLWGRGRSASCATALALEQAALVDYAELCEALEFTGLTQARRALFVKPHHFAVEADGGGCIVTCWLPPGAYATAMLATAFECHDASQDASLIVSDPGGRQPEG